MASVQLIIVIRHGTDIGLRIWFIGGKPFQELQRAESFLLAELSLFSFCVRWVTSAAYFQLGRSQKTNWIVSD